ncbi:MAG: hypothetical protein ACRD04_10910 [Terriglobales bacterium]
MVLALAILLLICWWLLWGIFHLAGSGIHVALAAGLGFLVFRLVKQSDLRHPRGQEVEDYKGFTMREPSPRRPR